MSLSKLTTSVVALSLTLSADAQACVKFSARFSTPQSIATDLWYDAFSYETDEVRAYDMWPDDPSTTNPNDVLTQQLRREGIIENSTTVHFDEDGLVDSCLLGYDYHKGQNESVANDEHPLNKLSKAEICTPWAERACCVHDQVSEIQKFKDLFDDWYGAGGMCGGLSPQCEQFFIEEECMYACSPNAGLYRTYRVEGAPEVSNEWELYDPLDATHNEWQMHGMPIQASWFDNMWEACKNDMVYDENALSTAPTSEAPTSEAPTSEAPSEAPEKINSSSAEALSASLALAVSLAVMLA